MKKKIISGIYLIIDPSMEETCLLDKLETVAKEEIAAVQIWDNFYAGQHAVELVHKVCMICQQYDIPVLINKRWELLKHAPLDGIHFDTVPDNLEEIQKFVSRPFMMGITCNNDLAIARWAHRHHADYISFCSLFTSQTANSCELVSFDTVRQARAITPVPLFLAGGIKLDNIHCLKELGFDGLAVVSGIMNAEKPAESVKAYLKQLKLIRK